MANIDWSEHYIKRGDPKKPTYYIIRHWDPAIGIFAILGLVTNHICYALSKGWIPVVDLQNYPNAYLAPEKLGKENSWEYYFEQPLRIGLEQAYSGENVILCNSMLHEKVSWSNRRDILKDRDLVTEWRMFLKLGLIKIKPERLQEIAAEREKLFAPNERVLGVILRGTDYITRKPHGHCIPPPIEFAASMAIAKLQEWKCTKMFLATEDKNIVQTFKGTFGDLCVTFDREYVDFKPGQMIGVVRINRPNDHFLQGRDYLTQIMLVSACNSLVAARCGGAVGAMIFAENFEHTYFFNLGKYGMIGLD